MTIFPKCSLTQQQHTISTLSLSFSLPPSLSASSLDAVCLIQPRCLVLLALIFFYAKLICYKCALFTYLLYVSQQQLQPKQQQLLLLLQLPSKGQPVNSSQRQFVS